MSITVNLYYTGTGGAARAFAGEMVERGLVERVRAEKGNERYEYFLPFSTRRRYCSPANGGMRRRSGRTTSPR